MHLTWRSFHRWVLISVLAGGSTASSAAVTQVKVLTDVTYETPTGPQMMDLYLPEGSERVPALVWMHGAGGDKASPRERVVCKELAGAGFIVASINFAPSHAPSIEAVVACKSAVRFLRFSADRYSVDERRIGVAGASLGGSIALIAAFAPHDPRFEVTEVYPNVSDRVALVLSLSGPTDWLALPQPPAPRVHRAAIAELLELVSPVKHVTPDVPPVLLAHGTRDKNVPYQQAVQLDQQLRKAGVSHRLISLDRVGHTYSLTAANGRPLPEDLKSEVIKFLRTHFAAAN